MNGSIAHQNYEVLVLVQTMEKNGIKLDRQSVTM